MANQSPSAIAYRVYTWIPRKLTCYSQTIQGLKNRFKLRMRFYDEQPNSPVFLEVKRRVTDVIQKKRAMVDRSSAHAILRGSKAEPRMLVNDTPDEREAMRTFCDLRDQLGAVGKVFVDYYREAFQCGTGNHYRVTFDRNVCGSVYVPGSELKLPDRSTMTRIDGVVLEMKYVNNLPIG